MPRHFPEKPAPAALCPHGHEGEGYADADLQKRFLMLAKLGYVVLATPQDHHEDILHGYAYQIVFDLEQHAGDRFSGNAARGR